jgi:hypothetical protein
MRVVCVQPARDPVLCGDGPVLVGSAPEAAVVLAGADIAPRHLTLVADARGLVLDVQPGAQHVYVNARAVHEHALLHYGDVLTLGSTRLLVTTDAPPAPLIDGPSVGEAPGQAALRVASGADSGRMLAVAPVLHLGAGTRHCSDLPYSCRVTAGAEGLLFEADDATPCINGWHCARACLAPGDQIALGQQRFIVEAPGLEYAAHMAALPPPAAAVPAPPMDAAPPTEIWWLIAAAAALAMIIAMFLYFRW